MKRGTETSISTPNYKEKREILINQNNPSNVFLVPVEMKVYVTYHIIYLYIFMYLW